MLTGKVPRRQMQSPLWSFFLVHLDILPSLVAEEFLLLLVLLASTQNEPPSLPRQHLWSSSRPDTSVLDPWTELHIRSWSVVPAEAIPDWSSFAASYSFSSSFATQTQPTNHNRSIREIDVDTWDCEKEKDERRLREGEIYIYQWDSLQRS